MWNDRAPKREAEITLPADFVTLAAQSWVPAFPEFSHRLTPDYHSLLGRIQRPHFPAFEICASAVRGFHFSIAATDSIHPSDGHLWYFPKSPSRSDLAEISVAAATSNGWGRRKAESLSTNPVTVFCYEIHPDQAILDRLVTVRPNLGYGSRQLQGLEVLAPDSSIWNVVDRRLVTVSGVIGKVVES